MKSTHTPELISISELSHVTGVNSVTLRAWERRYGLLKPKRSSKGHRLYNNSDIDKVRAVLAWINKGVSVGKVRPLLDNNNESETTNISNQWNNYQQEFIQAARKFNENKIDALYKKITKQYPLSTGIKYCFMTLFESQENTPIATPEQYFLSSCLKARMNLSLLALNKNRNKKSESVLLFMHYSLSSWKVWISALLLIERGFKVHVFDEIKAIDSSFQTIKAMKPNHVIIYTELKPDTISDFSIKELQLNPNIYITGPKIWLAKNTEKLGTIDSQILLNPFDTLTLINKKDI